MTVLTESKRPRPPRVRFAIWVVLAVGLSVGQGAWILLTDRTSVDGRIALASWAVLALMPLVLFALLATTPTNAIRLRARVSALVVPGVSGVLLLASVVSVVSGAIKLEHVDTLASVVIAVALLSTVVLLVRANIREGVSPWWTAVFAWHPAVVLAAARAQHTPFTWLALMALLICIATLPKRVLPIVYFVGVIFSLVGGSDAIALWLVPLGALVRLNGRLGWTALLGAAFIASPHAFPYLPDSVVLVGLIGCGLFELTRHVGSWRRPNDA